MTRRAKAKHGAAVAAVGLGQGVLAKAGDGHHQLGVAQLAHVAPVHFSSGADLVFGIDGFG